MTQADSTAVPELVTSLDRRWLLKIGLMTAFLAGFSLWGLFDATVAYPARGVKVAETDLRESIRTASDEGRADQVSVSDPVAELRRLNDKQRESANLKPSEQAKQRWLESLDRVGRLTPTYTVIPNVLERKAELEAAAAADNNSKEPSRLSAWDIPAQWGITAVCGLGAVWMLALMLLVASKKYRWDPEGKRLTLPDGNSLVPTDIAEFDKRKWHKFLIDLGIKPEHPTLGGKVVKLDLYRYAGLEEWVLEMEHIVHPEASGQTADAVPLPPPHA